MNQPIVNCLWHCGPRAVFAVALLVSVPAYAAPRVGDGPAPRGKDKAGSESARLVTSESAHINGVVAGTPPTAIIAITPVPAKVGSYPPGTTIVGNQLTAGEGGFRAFFEVQVSNWDPNGDGSPALHTLQVTADSAGYRGEYAVPPNAGCDLDPPFIPCTDSAVCATRFGEAWAKCELSFCKQEYVDKTGTKRPPDNFCAPDSCSQGDAYADADPVWFDIYSLPNRPDGHIVYYVGSFVLDVPACAKGKYTVNLHTDRTFLADADSTQFPTAQENGFVINIVGGVMWDLDPLSPDRTSRSLRFKVTAQPLAAAGALNAIRVESVELMHPNPRNVVATPALPTQTVPPNFSAYDTDSNGVCSGATASPNYNNHPCGTDADCVCNTPSCAINDAAHNGVCSSLQTCSAGTGESVPPNAQGEGGCARWVGKPGTFLEAQQQPTWGHYRAARLQCTPFYYDWVAETAGKVCAGPVGPLNSGAPCTTNCTLKKCNDLPWNTTCTGTGQGTCPTGDTCEFVNCISNGECTVVSAGTCPSTSVDCLPGATCIPKKITVVGAEILPSSTYSVQTYGASCQGSENACTDVSAPVTMSTRRHGDVAEPLIAPNAVGQPNAIDVSRMVDAFGKKGPLRKASAKITPNLPEENLDIGADDIGTAVDALKFAYALTGPCPCPSTVACGTPCACDAGPPCPACGGGQCVKMCSVGSMNEGLPCRDNDPIHNHCPGGTCGSGFCRDKCGRCTP